MVLRFFMFASVFFLASCVSIDRNNPDDPSSYNYYNENSELKSSSSLARSISSAVVYSSSSKPSSSSIVRSSSSMAIFDCTDFTEGTEIEHYGKSKAQFCDPRDGKKYVYVKIGSKIWMAENLNYNVSGRKCYDNIEDNCNTYGSLYDWATAMKLPPICNSNDCRSEIKDKHQGICPDGWHISSQYDWYELLEVVGDSSAIKLKTTSGWEKDSDYWGDIELKVEVGTDNGFSALPGGYGYSFGTFQLVGDTGMWLTSEDLFGESAGSYTIGWSSIDVYSSSLYKNMLGSVRCVMD